MVYAFEASPGSVANSSVYEEMCLYHLAAWGYLAASGADLRALKVAASACEGEYLAWSQSCGFTLQIRDCMMNRRKIQRCT